MHLTARRRGTGLFLVLALLAPWHAATAAPNDRTFSGTVLGNNGQPVPNAGLAFCEGSTAACGSFVNVNPSTGAFSVSVAGVVSDRPINGSIRGTDDAVLGGAFLHACPGEAWTKGCAGARIIGADPGSGGFSGYLDKSLSYRAKAGAHNGAVYGDATVAVAPDATATPILTGVLTVAAGPARTVSGTVVDLDGLPNVANTLQVWACPDGGNTGGCPGRSTSFVQPNGSYSMVLDATETYRIWAVSLAPAMFSVRQDVAPGAEALTRSFTFELHGRMRGTVTRIGFPTPFPQGMLGVGACPITSTGAGEACADLQYAFAASDGTYDFRLPPATYRISGFMFVDGVLVIGEGEEVEIGSATDITGKEWPADVPEGELVGVDGNGDGVADNLQDWVATIGSPIDGSGRITIATKPGYPLVNVAPRDLSGYASLPPMDDPWGSLSFTVGLINQGETIVVDLYFQTAVPEEAVFYKFATASGTWDPFAGFQRINAYYATLTLTDGDAPGDYDGEPNEFITDPMVLDFVGDRSPSIEGFAKPLRAGYTTKADQHAPAEVAHAGAAILTETFPGAHGTRRPTTVPA